MLNEGGGDGGSDDRGEGERKKRNKKKEEKREEGEGKNRQGREREDSRYTCPRHISSMHRIACGRRDIPIIFDILFIIVPGSGSILRSRRNRRVEVSVPVPITIIVVDRSGSGGGNTPITAVIIVVRWRSLIVRGRSRSPVITIVGFGGFNSYRLGSGRSRCPIIVFDRGSS
jgi:hypothetical protein